ncbi:hypothetical protein ABKV19_004241 [Rosa sericea]
MTKLSTISSLVSDVLIVLLCSLVILGLLFRQMNISSPGSLISSGRKGSADGNFNNEKMNKVYQHRRMTMGQSNSQGRVVFKCSKLCPQ